MKLLISKPVYLIDRDVEDITIKEALQTIYPYTKEAAVYMYWNGYILELWLSAEISDIFNDIIKMLDFLQTEKEFNIFWGSSAFFGIWKFKNENNLIKLESGMSQLRGGKEISDQLSKVSSVVTIDKVVFIKEWIKFINANKRGFGKSRL